MATSRLLSKPPAGCATQRSWSCSPRLYTPKCIANSLRNDNSILDSKNQILNTDRNAGNRNTVYAAKVATQAGISQRIDLVTLWDSVAALLPNFAINPANWKLNPAQTQGFIERVIVDCRFFTILAVAGSLLGSILCFVEGLVIVLQSYFRYFEAVLYKQDHASIVDLLVEAIDVFLVGTAMFIFGMGLYLMFVGSKSMNHKRQPRKVFKSNFFSLLYLKTLPSWLKMDSVSEAKTRIGHAVLMILQVGMLDKFKSVPLVTGLDLASFAAALLLSSASIFCLSKLSHSEAQQG